MIIAIIVWIILIILLSIQIIAFGLFILLLLDYWIIAILLLDYFNLFIRVIVIIASQFKICVDLILKKKLFDTALYCTRS